jgi:hypothetical protein
LWSASEGASIRGHVNETTIAARLVTFRDSPRFTEHRETTTSVVAAMEGSANGPVSIIDGEPVENHDQK